MDNGVNSFLLRQPPHHLLDSPHAHRKSPVRIDQTSQAMEVAIYYKRAEWLHHGAGQERQQHKLRPHAQAQHEIEHSNSKLRQSGQW